MKFLTQPWNRIASALSKAETRTVVSAYLGAGAEQMLPLGDGDLLLVNASLAAVRSGQTDPRVLLRMHKKGVRCFSRARLHAKTYVADDLVFVGSPNASTHSRDVLLEVCLEVKSKSLATRIRTWAHSLVAEELTEKRIAALCKEYDPPRFRERSPHKRRRSRKGRKRQDTRRLWITSISPTKRDVPETAEMKADERAAETQLSDRRFALETIYCNTKRCARLYKEGEPGDQVIVISHGDGKRVYGPMRLIKRATYKTSNGISRRLYLEWDEQQRGASYPRFKKTMKNKAELRLSDKANVQRLVGSEVTATALRAYLDRHA